ncbi:MAG: hypothetical protein WD136_06050 [Cyanobium sp.]
MLAALIGIASLVAVATPVQAQSLLRDSCPLVVPESQRLFQPKRIKPSQVASKNAMGCLSPADAVYGESGCPLRLCSAGAGVIEMPQGL